MTEPIWADPTDTALMLELADFISAEIEAYPAYISHGEIQTGLSLDGQTWHEGLAARMRADLIGAGPDRSVLYARSDGHVVAAAIILWALTDRVRFAVIEDMAVARPLRSTGLGAVLMNTIETTAKQRDIQWLFLESGLHNERAHAFFERSGFHTVSKVMSKRL